MTRVVALHIVGLIVAVLAREGALGVQTHREAVFLEERALQPEAVEP